jgi:hypothetical protein
MAISKKVKGGKKAIKDLELKDVKAVDVRGGYLQLTLKNAQISSYQLG